MTAKLIIALGALLASVPSLAQSAPAAEQSAEDMACQLSGDCSGMANLEASQDKPASRGFKLERKTTNGARQVNSSSTKAANAKIRTDALRPAAAAANPGRSRKITSGAPSTPPGRLNLRVTFVTGSSELTEAGRREADKFMLALSAPSLTGKRFRIEGHTDSVGSHAANVDLSRRRAQAVIDYLAFKGTQSSRFGVVGYGPDKPLAGFPASAGANRRVEIVLIK